MKSLHLLICLPILFSLYSCSSTRGHAKIISFTPASVIIDFTDTGDMIEATDQAQRYCKSVNKDAQYVRSEADSSFFGNSKKVAFFNCIEAAKESGSMNQQQVVIPFNNNNNNNNNNNSSNNNR